MNGKDQSETREFVEEQLMETTHALFAARSVREIQFLQSKLNYLKQRMKEMKKKKR